MQTMTSFLAIVVGISTTIDVFLPAKLFIVQGEQSIWFDRNATKIDRLAPYYVFH